MQISKIKTHINPDFDGLAIKIAYGLLWIFCEKLYIKYACILLAKIEISYHDLY